MDASQAGWPARWDPILIPTAAAMAWLEQLDLSGVEVVTGQRLPGEPRRVPTPSPGLMDAIDGPGRQGCATSHEVERSPGQSRTPAPVAMVVRTAEDRLESQIR